MKLPLLERLMKLRKRFTHRLEPSGFALRNTGEDCLGRGGARDLDDVDGGRREIEDHKVRLRSARALFPSDVKLRSHKSARLRGAVIKHRRFVDVQLCLLVRRLTISIT